MKDILSIGDPGRAATHVGPGLPPQAAWPSDISVSEHDASHFIIRGASVRGVLHRHLGSPRQDSYAIARGRDDDLVAAVVCDGVGSLHQSHVAAELVATVTLENYLEGRTWQEAIGQANDDLRRHIAHESMATTVVAVSLAMRPDGIWVDAACVGDSELQHLQESGWRRILPPSEAPSPQPPEIATGRTKALPTADLRVAEWSGLIEGGPVFLMTDGVGLPLKMSSMVRQKLAEWWAAAPRGLDFAQQVGFAKSTFVDDRTVVGFWHRVLLEREDVVNGEIP